MKDITISTLCAAIAVGLVYVMHIPNTWKIAIYCIVAFIIVSMIALKIATSILKRRNLNEPKEN